MNKKIIESLNNEVNIPLNIQQLNIEIDRLKQVNSLVNDAYALKLLWTNNFIKALLVEWEKTDNEIDAHIDVLKKFEKDTEINLKNHFKFLR